MAVMSIIHRIELSSWYLMPYRCNCGTWMDKMGESAQAGNRGIPATPRIGAPIEITGLLKSTLRWLASINGAANKVFPFEGVELSTGNRLSYTAWDALVQSNFDKCYYVPENPDDDAKRILNSISHSS